MKKRVMVRYFPENVEKPLIYHLIKQYDIVINILRARIFPEEKGQLIIEMENSHQESIDQGIRFLRQEGLEVEILEKSIIFDRDKCMDCGVCTGVCKAGALSLNRKEWELMVDDSKCVLCEMCVEVCPVSALSLEGKW